MRRNLLIILSLLFLLLFVGCAYDLNKPIRVYVENGYTYYQFASDEAVTIARYKKTGHYKPVQGVAWCSEKIIYYTDEANKKHETKHCLEGWEHGEYYNRFLVPNKARHLH